MCLYISLQVLGDKHGNAVSQVSVSVSVSVSLHMCVHRST